MEEGMNAHPPCVVLDKPQLAENIGAVARAMANFGLSELRLVRPRDGWPQPRAWPAASGAESVLEAARVFESLPQAIGDLTLVLATTARPREAVLPVMTPREAAARLARIGAEERSGLLFGGERAGLETADVALCQGIVTIPVDPTRRSLNLAQAVAINAYEWRMTWDDRAPENFPPASPPAPAEALMGFYEQLENELDASGFFHPPEKRESMVRNLRAALGKAGFTNQEVRTLRGVVTALSRGRGKVLAKIAAARSSAGPPPDDLTER
jgi:tRNA/rRNA methyltransferase